MFADKLLESLVLPGRTKQDQKILSIILQKFDAIAEQEHFTSLKINLTDLTTMRRGQDAGSNLHGYFTPWEIFVGIIFDAESQSGYEYATMHKTFLHELAHAIRERDSDGDSKAHDRLWRAEFEKLLHKYPCKGLNTNSSKYTPSKNNVYDVKRNRGSKADAQYRTRN